jgi:hypothetical protein
MMVFYWCVGTVLVLWMDVLMVGVGASLVGHV